jgi:hypothetical protein
MIRWHRRDYEQAGLMRLLVDIPKNLRQACVPQALPGNEQQPRGWQLLVDLPINFSKQPPRPVAHNGAGTVTPGNQKRRPAHSVRRRFQDNQDAGNTGVTPAHGTHGRKLLLLTQPGIWTKGRVALARPRAGQCVHQLTSQRQADTPFAATIGQYPTATLSGHASAETQLALARQTVWLKCSFHACIPCFSGHTTPCQGAVWVCCG